MRINFNKNNSRANLGSGIIKENIFLFSLIALLLAGLLLFSIILAVTFGPVKIKPFDVWKIILNNTFHINLHGTALTEGPKYQIIWNIRFPRVLLGAIVGAGLSITGVAMQALVKNPLAEPYVLGVSSGASIGATFIILIGGVSFFGIHSIEVAAFLGALISSSAVFLLSKVNGRVTPVKLLLSGVIVGSLCSSITSFIIFKSNDAEGIKTVTFWLMGSLVSASWRQLQIPALTVILGVIFLTLMHRPLNVMLMGDDVSLTLGVNVDKYRKILMLISSLLTGIMVSMVGCIGFVGLIIPHIVRFMVGADHKKVLPLSALVGAIFMVWTDVFARTIAAPEELPIGIITSLLGAPFFLWLMCKNSYSFGGNE